LEEKEEKRESLWQKFKSTKAYDKLLSFRDWLMRMLQHLTLPYKEMIRGKGVTRRWLFTTFSLLGTMLIAIFIITVSLINSFYYNNIQQIIEQRASVTSQYFAQTAFNSYTAMNENDYRLSAQSFVEGFADKDKMEIQFINGRGSTLISSSGFEPPEGQPKPDYYLACKNGDRGTWNGVNENNEHVYAVSCILELPGYNGYRAIRMIVSLEPTDAAVRGNIILTSVIMLIVLLFISLSSSYFIRSIVNPVKGITNIAGHIAAGDFSIRLEKEHDDEIGDLVDSINAMAAELALSENAKNDFISSVSHELRTPLTAIKGWSETVLMCGTEDEAMIKRGMGIIINETERLSGLVEQLLDFSRMQSGRMVMNFQMLDIVAEIDDVVFMFKDKAQKEDKRLTFYEPETPIPVMGDRDKLKQVIIIVIDNAMKYSEPGGEIFVYTSVESDMLTIGVRDYGCGISADQLPKVKQKFYKANTSKGGFGIGLAVADEIIRKHNGEFNIDSVEGEGTNVSIILPVARQSNATEQAEKAQ
jgi:Signal transduction histidine kinase